MTYDEAINITANYCINNDNELAEAIKKLIEQNDELKGLLHIKINWGDN